MSNFQIQMATPSDVIVGSNHAKVVAMQDDVVWSKFDEPSSYTAVPISTNSSVTGFKFTVVPTSRETGMSIVGCNINIDMQTYKVRIQINLERTFNYPSASFVWRVGSRYTTPGNPSLWHPIIGMNDFPVRESSVYNVDELIPSAKKVIELNIGDTFSDHESLMQIKFIGASGTEYFNKTVSAIKFDKISSFINGYPKLNVVSDENFLVTNSTLLEVGTLT